MPSIKEMVPLVEPGPPQDKHSLPRNAQMQVQAESQAKVSKSKAGAQQSAQEG
jgi:hypothetical protein